MENIAKCGNTDVSFFPQDGLLGIFQKLIASKANDHDGFHLIQDLMEHMPA